MYLLDFGYVVPDLIPRCTIELRKCPASVELNQYEKDNLHYCCQCLVVAQAAACAAGLAKSDMASSRISVILQAVACRTGVPSVAPRLVVPDPVLVQGLYQLYSPFHCPGYLGWPQGRDREGLRPALESSSYGLE